MVATACRPHPPTATPSCYVYRPVQPSPMRQKLGELPLLVKTLQPREQHEAAHTCVTRAVPLYQMTAAWLASERGFWGGGRAPPPQKSGRRWVASFPQLVITNSIRVQHSMNAPAATAIQCTPAMKLWKLIVVWPDAPDFSRTADLRLSVWRPCPLLRATHTSKVLPRDGGFPAGLQAPSAALLPSPAEPACAPCALYRLYDSSSR